jgi:hypothetical protein
MFWLQDLKERDHSEYISIDEKIIFEWILWKEGGKLWAGCIWLRVETSGGLL